MGVDDQTETAEANKELGRFSIKIDDNRREKDPGQEFGITERLKKDKVDLALAQTKRLLGKYSPTTPEKLQVSLIEGELGEGTIKNKGTEGQRIIEIQLSTSEKATKDIEQGLGPILDGVNDKELKAKEISEALVASTILHEGVHGLLESRPDSQFAQDFENVTGFPNDHGETSTLLDEGIAYAIQRIYAPDIEPLGSIAPVSKEGEKRIVQQRKNLGEKLRSKVKEYIDQEKTIDSDFFEFAKGAIIEVMSQPSQNEQTKITPEIENIAKQFLGDDNQ